MRILAFEKSGSDVANDLDNRSLRLFFSCFFIFMIFRVLNLKNLFAFLRLTRLGNSSVQIEKLCVVIWSIDIYLSGRKTELFSLALYPFLSHLIPFSMISCPFETLYIDIRTFVLYCILCDLRSRT
jgi:hypothetical protein